MSKNIFLLLLSLLLFEAGCATAGEKAGLDDYITQKVSEYSGRTFKNEGESSLRNMTWKSKEDEGGLVIVVSGDHFAAINTYFTHLLGPPNEVTTNYLGNPKAMYYRAQNNGVSVEYSTREEGGSGNNVIITILKPKS